MNREGREKQRPACEEFSHTSDLQPISLERHGQPKLSPAVVVTSQHTLEMPPVQHQQERRESRWCTPPGARLEGHILNDSGLGVIFIPYISSSLLLGTQGL